MGTFSTENGFVLSETENVELAADINDRRKWVYKRIYMNAQCIAFH